MAVRAVRGAVQLEETSPEAVRDGARRLVLEVLERNALTEADLISVLFTNTPDLIGDFPAVGARQAGLTQVPLMCAVEIAVPGALPRVVRLMAHVETERSRDEVVHVYLDGAVALRPDHAGTA